VKSGYRLSLPPISQLLTVGLCLAWPAWVWPQSVVATLPVSGSAVAVNKVTNRIYVAGGMNADSSVADLVTVIDGATHSTTTIQAGLVPFAVAANEATNKIYVANLGRTYLFQRGGKGIVTVIDGATNFIATVIDPNAEGPRSIAVNPLTNKIYVANDLSHNVTVIDGATNSTTTIADPNATRLAPVAVAVNPVTNKIYVANQNIAFPPGNPGNITVIDGQTNTTTTVTDPNAFSPNAVAVNTVTNRIYVTNRGAYPAANHGNVTVIDGVTNSTTTVVDPNAVDPRAVAVNQTTDKIYVANAGDLTDNGTGIVTVIDGATNAVTTVRNPLAPYPSAVAVNEDTNRVFVADAGSYGNPGNNLGGVTVINGDTDSVTTVIDPNAGSPEAITVNPVTNQIYVANSDNLTVLSGDGTATSHALEVLLPGTGSGAVSSDPSAINCGTVCIATFSPGTSVRLSAAASSGSYFSGWSGPCSGTSSCELTMSADEVVGAIFGEAGRVPNVAGLTQAQATMAISAAGLLVGTVSQQSSTTVASGDVISESPAAGTEAASGSTVALVVSSGEGGGSGGGGGNDVLTLAALLSALIVGLRRR
jgi:DNA-binding beta-propeller fold protein YncE